jgi:hypothetical protein
LGYSRTRLLGFLLCLISGFQSLVDEVGCVLSYLGGF